MDSSQASQKEKDIFEKASYIKAILTLALPSILGQLILVIYNLADTFFIGLAGRNATFTGNPDSLLAGVTICMPVYMILTAVSNLFGIGAASVMSRSMGKQNYERARNASRFAFWCCIFTTIIYSLLVLLFINPLCAFFSGFNEDVAQYAKSYLLITVVICGLPTALNTLLSHLFRAEGRSIDASIGIGLGGILNVILDPLFIFVLIPIDEAAISAALATGISNTIALLYYIILYLKDRKTLVISFIFKKKMFNENVPRECLIIGLPACLMTLCENISYMFLDHLIGLSSAAALAGVGTAKKVNMVAHSTVRGMTQGVLPLIGYNKASGNRHRMRMIVYISGAISLGIAIICAVVNTVFAIPLSSVFQLKGDSLKYAGEFLMIFSIGAPFSALAYTAISFFQAVGKAWRSLALALLRKGILDIPLMFIIQNIVPIYGVVWATPIADCVCCITAIILFIVYIKHHGHDRHAGNTPIQESKELASVSGAGL